MRQNEVPDKLRQVPFQPMRVHLSDGKTYDVRHPELAALTRHSIHIVLPSDDSNGDQPDRVLQCDLLHVVALEPINGAG